MVFLQTSFCGAIDRVSIGSTVWILEELYGVANGVICRDYMGIIYALDGMLL